MKVALVHDWLTGMRGGEKCLEVFCELYPDADLYTLIYTPENVSPTIQRMNVRTSWLDRLPAAAKYFRYLLPLFPQAVESFELVGYDLILSSSHCVAKGIFPHRSLHVSYIFAPMRYVWDLHDAYFVGSQSQISRIGLAAFRAYLQRWDVRSSARVNHFIAISSNIAAKIERFYGRRAKVIYPPVDVERFYVGREIDSFYLIVSALVPYKRIDVAIEAFNALRLPLKVVGSGPLRRSLERRAKPNIEFLGWLDDAKVAELYASCQALIFPGEEDFGIVPLEAQASGRPVIAFKRGGLLETVIGLDEMDEAIAPASPTGVFFTDQNSQSLSAAVRQFERHRDRFEPERIRAHARQFGRDRFKREIATYIDECLARGSSGV
jgi:glycosyltransferase involved in cell wall biosynthesis